ncbi:hypothetical protein CAPTEDRAFT_161630 [Capitella teleta]|uniref:Large ribosomal subunit protein uL15m n=1 Tax=Capitella teleta TaxID=283909 RepID=N1PB46_CAPTE|nr:hypothetical protein CAPTEDRAFT_161630 [Capitella teleta]|eukprot:ELU18877.1 hypothetical protein CAPTEDRAFT_161630 [Capitella teleta]
MASGAEKALNLLKQLPRVEIGNLRGLPGQHAKRKIRRGQHGGGKSGRGSKGQGAHKTLPRIGFEGGNTPFYLAIPKEPYYFGHHVKREYPPVSLFQLQRLIDLGRVDTKQPIDLTTLCNTKIRTIDPFLKHSGINLVEEGAEIFTGKVNIEVQFTSELVIATIERNGGTITSRYYDQECVRAMSNPLRFFGLGKPVPRCMLPPEDAVEFYSDPKNRGYLADPAKIQEAREELAQKYGYELPDISKDPDYEMLKLKKDPRQIWYGLEPGWVVNMLDKAILKPKDQELKEFYQS